jgi:ATP-dependent DNA helicase HFM1/MER3
LATANLWLKGTFFFVRLQKNSQHYQLGKSQTSQNANDVIESICESNIRLLQEHGLITESEPLRPTSYGEAVAQYYVQIQTASIFIDLPSQAKMSEIVRASAFNLAPANLAQLSALCQAEEFKNIRFRQGEKGSYKELNKSNLIRFPIPGNLDGFSHKVSLIIQSVLGGIELSVPSESPGIHHQYRQEQGYIWQNIKRLVRCIIDFAIHRNDSVSARNGLMICRSIASSGWDDGPMQLQQLENIGIASVRKLCAAGITSLESLEETEPHKIERALKKAPPYGRKILDALKNFPKLRVSISLVGRTVRILF